MTPNNSNLLAIEKIEKSLSYWEFETSDRKWLGNGIGIRNASIMQYTSLQGQQEKYWFKKKESDKHMVVLVRVIKGEIVQKWPEGRQKLLQVSGRFELM